MFSCPSRRHALPPSRFLQPTPRRRHAIGACARQQPPHCRQRPGKATPCYIGREQKKGVEGGGEGEEARRGDAGEGTKGESAGEVGKPADRSPSCLASGAPSAASLPLREERGPLCYRRLAAMPCASLGAEQWGEGGGRNRARSEEQPPGGNPRRSDYREATLGGATTGRQRCVGWRGKA
jgi:hypothetical protein